MLLQAKVVSTRDEGRKLLENNLYSGKAYKVFLEFVKAQHGVFLILKISISSL